MPNNLLPTPPSGRDFEVYRTLHVDRVSTRDAARLFQLSQTRVCQIDRKVAEYLIEVAPTEKNDRCQQRLFVAEQIASLRVDFLYGKALRGWEKSQGEVTSTRQLQSAAGPPMTVRTTRPSAGECRYLQAAARLALMAAKLPAADLDFGSDLESASDKDAATAPASDVHPPVRDCSLGAGEQGKQVREAAAGSRLMTEVCGSRALVKSSALLTEIFPVQSLSKAASSEDVSSAMIIPTAKVASDQRLTSQQRKARRKLLAKKLKQAK